MTLPDKLFEQMDELIALQEKQTDLMRQLKRAYLLANVIGMHPNQIKGKLSTATTQSGIPLYSRPWKTEELVVRLDGEEVARKKLIDVPLELWPADIRDEYQRYLKRNKKPTQE
jgi:hypothetical protein